MKSAFGTGSPRATSVVAIVFALAVFFAPSGDAQIDRAASARLRSLNSQLLDVYARLVSLPAAERRTARAQAASIIQQRAKTLTALVQQNPVEALKLALPIDVLADLKDEFAEVAGALETQGTWEGPLEYLIEDSADLRSHRDIRRIKLGNETFELQFAGPEPEGLESGVIIHVLGVRIGAQIAALDASVVTTTAPEPSQKCAPIGEQKSIVLLVTMPGAPLPAYSLANVEDIFFGASGRSVNEFWREASYGVTTASGDVRGWYTLDANYGCYDMAALRDAAIRAADKAVDFSQYSRIFLIVNGLSGKCGWSALGTVGCVSHATADGIVLASDAWLASSYFTKHDQGVALAVHEGGHNLGLHHASTRDFGDETLGAPGVLGTLNEYGDMFSTMGYWNFGHYAAPHKQRLGWFGSDVQTVTSNGSFSLQPTEVIGATHALKIQRGSDSTKWIWVEYRSAIGAFDSTLDSHVFGVALIHYEDSNTSRYSHLLNFTPEAGAWNDPGLAVGRTWVDPYSNVSINVSSATASALNVSVYYGATPCITAAPTVTISPLNPSAFAGDDVAYSVSIKNNDSDSCASRNFDVASTLPNSWSSFVPATTLAVPPSTSASVSMIKTAPLGATPGIYGVEASVLSGTMSTTASANVTVKPPSFPLLDGSPSNSQGSVVQ